MNTTPFALLVGALFPFQAPAPTKDAAQPRVEPSFDPVFDPRGAPDHPGEITGIVLDPEGKPLAGARVIAAPRPRTSYAGVFERRGDLAPAASVTSGEQGQFACRVAPGRVHELFLADGHGAIARVDFASAGEHVEVRLAPPATLDVRVLEKKSGKPIVAVDVAAGRVEYAPLRQFSYVQRRLAQGKTDAAGHVRLSGLPPGVVSLMVQPEGFGSTATQELRLKAGESRSIDLPIEAFAHKVRGVVVDEKGAGIAGAEVDLALDFPAPMRTDAQGGFVLESLVAADFARFYVRARGFGTERVRLSPPIQAETTSVVQLKAGRRFRGRFVDPAGAAQAGVHVAIVNNPDVQDGPEPNDLALGTSGADGTFALADLRRDVTHFLVAQHERFALTFRHMPLDENVKDDLDLGTITLTDGAEIAGRAFDMGKTVQPGVDVLLYATPADRDVLRVGKSYSIPLETLVTSVRTDSLGRYAFAGIPAGIVAPIAQGELGTVRLPDLQIAAGSARTEVDLHIVVQPGRAPSGSGSLSGTVEGRALDQDGKPCACALVTLTPEETNGLVQRTTFSDERGAFRLANVVPSRYWTIVEQWQGIDHASPLLARKVVAPGETSVLGDLRLSRCILVKGRVVEEAGAAGRTWLVRASSEIHALATVCLDTDEKGAFSFYIEEGAPLTISALPLALDPSKPKSALNATPPRETVLRDVIASTAEIVIHVPAPK